jgi:L,D-peptidoglycan transpeptidase YkuD (ErfK/YbiS/YcfS/YnhG family)
MIIHVKNKDTLVVDDFYFKCAVGKKGLNLSKKEGDYTTPKGLFNLNKLYYRKDRIGEINSNIKKKIISKNIGWCDDPTHKKYNEEIHNCTKHHKERFYRKDNTYDYLITISHNHKKVPKKGSAIFIHLTKNYKPTAGCIALKKKDFEILLKLIDKKTKIKIS